MALTTIDKEGDKAGIGVMSGILAAGAQKQSDKSNESVSYIKFTLPIALSAVKIND